MATVQDVTDEDFQSEVLEAEGPVFVEFWGSDCESCEYVAPFLKKLAKEFDGRVKVVKVFADDAPDTHSEYGVEGYPKLVLFQDGEEVEECTGEDETVPDLAALRDFLTGHVGEAEEEAEEEEEEEEEEASADEEEEEEEEEEESDEEEASSDEEEEEEEAKEEGPGLLEVASGVLGALFGGDDKKKKRDDEDE